MGAFLVYSIDKFGFGEFSPKIHPLLFWQFILGGSCWILFLGPTSSLTESQLPSLSQLPLHACSLPAWRTIPSWFVPSQSPAFPLGAVPRGTLLCHRGLSCRRVQSPWIFFEERDWAPGRDLLWDVSSPVLLLPCQHSAPLDPGSQAVAQL